ncbi:hypothetical protein, partial [Klebsiella pneumoniae]|uniref:hypothetical protein n=1 Tax=Klebsiella pneumoniae TaxID=573 RepID=UPI0025A0DC1F
VVGGDDGRHIPLLHIVNEYAFYGLARYGVKSVKGFVAEYVVRSRANGENKGGLSAHTLGKGAYALVSLQTESAH